jgi:hypothetical protein
VHGITMNINRQLTTSLMRPIDKWASVQASGKQYTCAIQLDAAELLAVFRMPALAANTSPRAYSFASAAFLFYDGNEFQLGLAGIAMVRLTKLGLRLMALLLAVMLLFPMACLIGVHSIRVNASAQPGCHEQTQSTPLPATPDHDRIPHQKCCRAAQPAQIVAAAGSIASNTLNVPALVIAAVSQTQELPARSKEPGHSASPPHFQILRV